MLRALSLEEVAFVSGGMMDTDDGFDGDGGGGDDGGFGDSGGGYSDGGSDGAANQVYQDVPPDPDDIVVTGHQPPIVSVGGDTYAQFYKDGIAVLYHSDGGYFDTGIGATYSKMGNFTYSETTTSRTSTATSSINTTSPFSFTTTSGSEQYKWQHTDQP